MTDGPPAGLRRVRTPGVGAPGWFVPRPPRVGGNDRTTGGGPPRVRARPRRRGRSRTLQSLARRAGIRRDAGGLSNERLSIARDKVAERDLGDRVTIQQGDVRELRRVTVPGAPVIASVLGRLGLLQIMVTGQVGPDALTELAATGDYSPEYLEDSSLGRGFTSPHTFRADEFEGLLVSGSLDVHQVVGLEGLASGYAESAIRERAEDLDGEDHEHRELLRDLVDLFREDRTVADLSAHILAVCEAWIRGRRQAEQPTGRRRPVKQCGWD